MALTGLGSLRRKWQRWLIATLCPKGEGACAEVSQTADVLLDVQEDARPSKRAHARRWPRAQRSSVVVACRMRHCLVFCEFCGQFRGSIPAIALDVW